MAIEPPSPTSSALAAPLLELWGGVECSLNRVGDEFFCQLSRSGHIERSSDIDMIASLGLRALRYPILWEKCAPNGFDSVCWEWPDARLLQLRELNIRPIVGLVHHGGGPRHTSLVHDEFALGLARWAQMVAERFPWVDAYTPVNEPLTTARFSALYGFWFPHARDDRSFARALVNQCRATVLAIHAIRRVNPRAILIQNEDIGEVYSSPRLAYQAEFENERRWLTFDLLCGRIVAGHPMHHFLSWNGIGDDELAWFCDNPCPPDVLGIDHYITSNRFLDEHVGAYPPASRGSNGRDEYVDVEAVRVDLPRTASIADLLGQAWQRYRTPTAIMEAHLGCTREEQMRWMHEVWSQALQARAEGVPVLGVTAWSLLGSHDWNSILTRTSDYYEPGAFDTRSPSPRPTAVAQQLRALGRGEEFEHPVLAQPGWWHSDGRVLFDSPGVTQAREAMLALTTSAAPSTSGVPEVLGAALGTSSSTCKPRRAAEARPLLIVGADGTLGRAFTYVCHSRGLLACSLSRFECDILDTASIRAALDAHRPWAVVNAAGNANVDAAESEREVCFALHARSAVDLARECAVRGLPLINFSSALVFDGHLGRPYLEEDQPRPLGVFGEAKARMEVETLRENPLALVVRAGALFGPWDRWNFPLQTLRALERGEEVRAAHDVRLSPAYVPYLAHAALDLLLDGFCGLWHGANVGEVSWYEWALEAARRARVDTSRLVPVARAEMSWKAPRPLNSALRSSRAWVMTGLDEAMDRFELERAK